MKRRKKRISISDISKALGRSFDSWIQDQGINKESASRGVERYLDGYEVNGWWSCLAIRRLYREFGLDLRDEQELPRPEVLEALILLRLEEIEEKEAA